MSWLAAPGGYELFMNRDELRRRRPAEPPRMRDGGGVRYLAPADGDFGGTWIAANERGVTLALLNRYQDETAGPGPGPSISRGLLVARLAACGRRARVLDELAALDLAPYRPFTLAVLAPPSGESPSGETVSILAWDGRRLAPAATAPPLASSSYDPRGIAERRRRTWSEALSDAALTSAALLAFHRSHRPERGPYSPCMHRDDARTVSFCRVRVTPARVAMAYADGPPCRTPVGDALTLARHEPDGAADLREAAGHIRRAAC